MVNDADDGELKKSHQIEWQLQWVHSVQDGQMHLAVKPLNTRWVRCSCELECQGAIAGRVSAIARDPTFVASSAINV